MVEITIRRLLAISLILFLLISSISRSQESMVSKDSIAFVRTLKTTDVHYCTVCSQLQQHRLSLETSPLIGGPSWLPLHVKVVLRSKERYHLWDLIPIDATNTTTLQKLVSLQHVPAQIRHRTYATSPLHNHLDDQASSQQELVYTNIYNADTLLEMTDNIHMSVADIEAPTEETSFLNLDVDSTSTDNDHLYILHAHQFCQSFMARTNMELHLIWNNCWTFAVQLMLYLLVHSFNENHD
jgi:hypothetical protein